MDLSQDPWYRLAVRPRVVKRALLMAFVVGQVLGAINHGHSILEGTMTTGDWTRFALTFLVPYCVSTLSSVLALREYGNAQGVDPTRQSAPLPALAPGACADNELVTKQSA